MKLFLTLRGDVYLRSFPETSVNRFNSLHFLQQLSISNFPFSFSFRFLVLLRLAKTEEHVRKTMEGMALNVSAI